MIDKRYLKGDDVSENSRVVKDVKRRSSNNSIITSSSHNNIGKLEIKTQEGLAGEKVTTIINNGLYSTYDTGDTSKN